MNYKFSCYNFYMKRAVVFAHYDKDCLIDDYVVYYIKALKEAGCDVVFVSCKELTQVELNKLNGLIINAITEKHDEYDFGSYKRGFLYLKPFLSNYDELIFANDSCYGPLYPISEVFEKMEKEDCDFWGITKNNFGYKKKLGHLFVRRPHIQSYFIALKKNVFTSEVFENFVSSIEHQENKKLIISKYEIGLTEVLVENGFSFKTFINAYENINNIAILKWRQIIQKYQMPFVKKSLFDLKNIDATTIENYDKVLTKFPCDLIKSPRKIQTKTPYFIKFFIFDTLANFPFPIRKFFAIIVKKLFPYIMD